MRAVTRSMVDAVQVLVRVDGAGAVLEPDFPVRNGRRLPTGPGRRIGTTSPGGGWRCTQSCPRSTPVAVAAPASFSSFSFPSSGRICFHRICRSSKGHPDKGVGLTGLKRPSQRHNHRFSLCIIPHLSYVNTHPIYFRATGFPAAPPKWTREPAKATLGSPSRWVKRHHPYYQIQARKGTGAQLLDKAGRRPPNLTSRRAKPTISGVDHPANHTTQVRRRQGEWTA